MNLIIIHYTDKLKEGSMILGFIQNNLIWIVPIVSIILTVLIRIQAKPSSYKLTYVDFFDFGFDLSISAIIVLLTELDDISKEDMLVLWLLVVFFILNMIVSIIVSRAGWSSSQDRPNILGVVLPDVIGIGMLFTAFIYIGGGK